MNLHIFNDEKFFDPFVSKLEQLNLTTNNKFIVRRGGQFKYIKRVDLVSSTLDSNKFSTQVGDISSYDKVFLHAFNNDLKRWVLRNKFNELNWMIWGSELYESKSVSYPLFEPGTQLLKEDTQNIEDILKDGLRKVKNYILNIQSQKAYQKIDNILTWITPEYKFAIQNIEGLAAQHKYFLYGFDTDIETLSKLFSIHEKLPQIADNKLKCILGNSGAITNNHVDALHKMSGIYFEEILIPVSYGHHKYVSRLKDKIKENYSFLNVKYMESFVKFKEYVEMFYEYPIFINNSLRPLGMGNIWLALLTGKIVFMNSKNFMYQYMKDLNLQVFDIDNIQNIDKYAAIIDREKNKKIVLNYLSTEKIERIYLDIFG